MPPESLETEFRRRGVIFPLHGIRTRARWINKFSEDAQNRRWVCRHDSWNYGRLSLLKFLSPWGRKAKEDWFVEKYSNEMNQKDLELSDKQLPSVVAHSFGCYLLGYAMLR